MSGLRRHWPLLALAAAAIIPVHDAVLRGRVLFYRDIHLAWHSAMQAFVRAVAQGSWPLWDPAQAFGQPLLAESQWAIAYPPTWLNLVMAPWAYYTLFAVAHLLWSGLGMYLLSRRWRCSRVAATAAACVWCLSGPAVSLGSLFHHLASAAWMPWIFLAAERALLRRRPRDVAACGAAMAAQVLAGSADMTAITWLALAVYAGARFIRWRRPLAPRNRALARVGAGALLLAVILSAVAWLPALEVVSRSARRALPQDTRTYWSLHPLGLLEAWVPELLHLQRLRPELRSLLSEGREPFLQSIYVGIATVPLVAAAFAGRRPRRRILGLLAVASVLVALGRYSFAYSALTTLLPPLRIFRYPVKAIVLFAWTWALLCGQGVEAWRQARGSARAYALAAAAAAAVTFVAAGLGGWLLLRPAAAAALLLADSSTGVILQKAGSILGAAAASALAAALALARWRRPAMGRRLAAAAALLAVADLAVRATGVNPTAPRRLYDRPPTVDLLRALRAQRIFTYSYTFGGGPREMRYARTPLVKTAPPGWDAAAASALAQQLSLVPNTSGRWGLDAGFEGDHNGLHPRELAELESLLTLLEGSPAHATLLRLGGITHVLSLDPMPELTPVAALDVMLEAPLRVYAVPEPLPRAFAVGAARPFVHAGELFDPAFDPRAEVLVSPGPAPPATMRGEAGRIAIEERRADSIRLRADMDREGYVVLLETYDPGWRVRVDGERRPLLRANGAFRAVRVEAGAHRVEMTYRPPAVIAGASLTLAGSAVAAALFLLGRRRPRAS